MQFNRCIGTLEIRGDVRAVLAGAVLLALLLNLGFWQLGRAEEKAALEARWQARSDLPAIAPRQLLETVAPEARADRQLEWRAELVDGGYLLLDNRLHRGRPGYHVVALARDLEGEMLIPLNLGWLAGDPSRRTTPTPRLWEGPATVTGRVYVPSTKPMMMQPQLPPDTLPAHVQTLYWENWPTTLSLLTGTEVFPYEVRVSPDSPVALLAEWPVVNQSPAKHVGYAVQWFAMALVLMLIGLLRMTNVRALIQRGSRA